jgi:hypothetical protein
MQVLRVAVSANFLGKYKGDTAFFEHLTVAQLTKKFPAFNGTRMFMTLYSRAHHWFPILSQINPVHTPPILFL